MEVTTMLKIYDKVEVKTFRGVEKGIVLYLNDGQVYVNIPRHVYGASNMCGGWYNEEKVTAVTE
jgi:hypothetical protein